MAKIFLDTGNPKDVDKAIDDQDFLFDGVTTNPTLISKVYSGRDATYRDIIREFRELGIRDISVETIGCPGYTAQSERVDVYVEEARIMHAIDPEVVTVKIPLTPRGEEATRRVAGEGIRVNNTLCFTLGQALLSGEAGAAYVSPFIGRLYDRGEDGMALVAAILIEYRKRGYRTKVLTASVREPAQVRKAHELGSHVITMPPPVFDGIVQEGWINELKEMQKSAPKEPKKYGGEYKQAYDAFEHPLLWDGVDRFLEDGRRARVRERILDSRTD